MVNKENEIEKAENAELREAYDTPSLKIESETDGDVFDTIIIKKNNDTASDEPVDESFADEDDTDKEDGVEAIDTLDALLYDDDDDTEFKPSEGDGERLPDFFAIGDMITKMKAEVETVDDIADEVEEATVAEEKSEIEEAECGDGESESDGTFSDEEEPAVESDEGDTDEAAVDAEQLEFDLGEETEVATDESEDSDDVTVGEETSENYDPEKPRFIDTVFDYFELLIFTLAAVMILTSFVFKHSVVDGSSMDQTLSDGEHLIIYGLFYQPERGDIIVCEDYSTRLKKPIVKRIIALPGEHIVISADGTVTIDGEVLDESGYVYINKLDYEYAPLDLVVPEGEVFVMGDHRNVSDDSRSEGVGTIDIDSILGKVVLRIYPFGDKFGPVE